MKACFPSCLTIILGKLEVFWISTFSVVQNVCIVLGKNYHFKHMHYKIMLCQEHFFIVLMRQITPGKFAHKFLKQIIFYRITFRSFLRNFCPQNYQEPHTVTRKFIIKRKLSEGRIVRTAIWLAVPPPSTTQESFIHAAILTSSGLVSLVSVAMMRSTWLMFSKTYI